MTIATSGFQNEAFDEAGETKRHTDIRVGRKAIALQVALVTLSFLIAWFALGTPGR